MKSFKPAKQREAIQFRIIFFLHPVSAQVEIKYFPSAPFRWYKTQIITLLYLRTRFGELLKIKQRGI